MNGLDYRRLRNPGRQVGVLLDASAQHGRPDRAGGAGGLGERAGRPGTRVPELLALVGLDQRANGLDPEGIFWMRGLLRDFADRGGTVLLSSHLLREVEAVADHLVMIGNGRIAADGAKTDLLAGSGVLVRAADADLLGQALDASGVPATRRADGSYLADADPAAVGLAAAAAGTALLELRAADGNGLEALFLSLTATEVSR